MAPKRHSTLSAAVAFLLWLFLRDPEAEAPVQAGGALEVMELTADNAHRLTHGSWYVVVGDAALGNAEPVFQSSYGVAFLQVVDLPSAELAARLGVRRANETVILSGREGAVPHSPEGCACEGGVFRPVCTADVLDYYFFFLAHKMKKRFSTKGCAEDLVHALAEAGANLLERLL